jgi:glucokinase
LSRPEQLVPGIPILEIGGTHVTAAWVDPADWRPSGVSRHDLDSHADANGLLSVFVAACADLDAPTGLHWGVAMPGPFDYVAGIGHFTGVGKFDALDGVDVRARLLQMMPCRPARISFINDASAFLVGEWLAGTAQDASRCVAITLGTGVGSAFLDDGVVVDSGPDVPPSAEVHLLDYAGHPLEDWVSRRAIKRIFAERSARSDQHGPNDLDVKEIMDLARSGDQVAAEVVQAAFQVLGEVLGPWLKRFGAEVLVLGGSISRSWDLIESPLRKGLSGSLELPVRVTADAERSALIGAAYPAFIAESATPAG